ncbi:antirestriction protein, partial [Klebsiella pneumoniae]
MNIALPDTSLVPAPITATLIPDEQRLSFWPQHFSTVPQWILLEPRVFSR